MSTGLYSGASGLALGFGLYRATSGLWGGASGLIAGFGGASLYLDFLTMTAPTFDSRITFTRGSNATLVDGTGKITYAPANLLTYTQEFDNAAWSKYQATVTANTTTAPDGTSTADKIVATAAAGFHYIFQSVTGTVAAYTFSVYAKAAEYSKLQLSNSGAGTWSATFDLATGATIATGGTAVLSSSIQSVGNGWYRCSVTFTGAAALTAHSFVGYPNSGATLNNFGASYTGDGTSGIYIWGAQLEPVTYQTTPSTYQATTSSAYYGPRFDYDPVTLAAKGLLIEEARTNAITYSEAFNNPIWVKSLSSITPDAVVSPSGLTDADKWYENTSTGAHQIGQTATFTSGVTYAYTFYAKKAERSLIVMYENILQGVEYASFNLDTGVATRLAPVTTGWTLNSVSMTNAGNGYYRCVVVATPGSTVTNDFITRARLSNGSTTSYTGDGTSGIYIWGAQLEAGSFATSYIPTVASTVTRSADVATMTGANFSSWYNQSQGTLVAEWMYAGANSAASASSRTTANISDGTANNRLQIYNIFGNVGAFVGTGGVTQAALDAGSTSPVDTVIKGALAYATNDIAFVRNGGSALTDTSATIPTVNSLTIGSEPASARVNGWVRSIRYYATRLPNSTLKSLTS